MAKEYTGDNYKSFRINGKHVFEHRFLAEKALGKPLPIGCVVHHSFGGKSGADIVICQDEGYHKLLHLRERAYLASGNPNKRKCKVCKEYDNITNLSKNKEHGSHKNLFYHKACEAAHAREWRNRNTCQT